MRISTTIVITLFITTILKSQVLESTYINHDSTALVEFLENWHKEKSQKIELNEIEKEIHSIYSLVLEENPNALFHNYDEQNRFFLLQEKIKYQIINHSFEVDDLKTKVFLLRRRKKLKLSKIKKKYPKLYKAHRDDIFIKLFEQSNKDEEKEISLYNKNIEKYEFKILNRKNNSFKELESFLNTNIDSEINSKSKWLNKFINTDYLESLQGIGYSLVRIIFNETMDKALLYFFVECGNGHVAPMVIKENGFWQLEE